MFASYARENHWLDFLTFDKQSCHMNTTYNRGILEEMHGKIQMFGL
ncbi:hypothetical protein CI957_253 [Methanohalophilus sp. WG1-DM]|nr:hypothetical protein CI957_253 [Methanohalophilus sp. WG1-DM]